MGKPEIRFKGYTDEWEQRKVVEVAPLQRGFDLPSASMKPGKYPVVMSNGIGGYHFEYKVKGPGVVTGRSGTIGKLHYIEDDYWPHNTTLWVTDFNGNNQKFIYYLYQGLDLNRFGTGSGVPTLNRNDVHDAIVSVPSKNEQERISAYLTILDQLITLHQRKCDEVKSLKKYMLQKMFPQNEQKVPEIRFEGFTEAWEQRKLEECLSEITYGFTNPMSDTEEGPWKITAKDILDGMINYSSARHTSQIEYDDLTNKSKPLVGDLLLTKDGTLGRTAIVDAENVCINQSVALLRFNEKCSVQYAKTLLDTPMYQKQMLDDAGGGTIKHIYITKVDKMFISVPCMKEQERLVLFFNNLDNLITLHQQKCEELKKIKKFMLQKMFV